MKNSFIPNPDFGNQYKEIKCTHCEKYLLLPFPITEYEIIDKQYKYIEELHCHFDNLVNELQRLKKYHDSWLYLIKKLKEF